MPKRPPFLPVAPSALSAAANSPARNHASARNSRHLEGPPPPPRRLLPVMDDRAFSFLEGTDDMITPSQVSRLDQKHKKGGTMGSTLSLLQKESFTSQTETPRVSNVSLEAAAAATASRHAKLLAAAQKKSNQIETKRKTKAVSTKTNDGDDNASVSSADSSRSRRGGKRRRRNHPPAAVPSQKPPLAPARTTGKPKTRSTTSAAVAAAVPVVLPPQRNDSLRKMPTVPEDKAPPPRKRPLEKGPTAPKPQRSRLIQPGNGKSDGGRLVGDNVQNPHRNLPEDDDNDDMDLASDEELVLSPDEAKVPLQKTNQPAPSTMDSLVHTVTETLSHKSKTGLVPPAPPTDSNTKKRASLQSVVLGKTRERPNNGAVVESILEGKSTPLVPPTTQPSTELVQPPKNQESTVPLSRGGDPHKKTFSEADLYQYRTKHPDNAKVMKAMMTKPPRTENIDSDDESDKVIETVRPPVTIRTVQVPVHGPRQPLPEDDEVSMLSQTSLPEVPAPSRNDSRKVQPEKLPKAPKKALAPATHIPVQSHRTTSIRPTAEVSHQPTARRETEPRASMGQKPVTINPGSRHRPTEPAATALSGNQPQALSSSLADANKKRSPKPKSGRPQPLKNPVEHSIPQRTVAPTHLNSPDEKDGNGRTKQQESTHASSLENGDGKKPTPLQRRVNTKFNLSPTEAKINVRATSDSMTKSPSGGFEEEITHTADPMEGVTSPSVAVYGVDKSFSSNNKHSEEEEEAEPSTIKSDESHHGMEELDEQTRSSDPNHPLRTLEHKQYTAEIAGFRQMAPFIRFPDGETYLHPPLPPGWQVSMCERRNKPYYWHPDFGRTYFPPIQLPSQDGFVRGFTPQFVVSTQGLIPPPTGDDVELDNGYDQKDSSGSVVDSSAGSNATSEPKEDHMEQELAVVGSPEIKDLHSETEALSTVSEHMNELNNLEQAQDNGTPLGDLNPKTTSPQVDDGLTKTSTHDEEVVANCTTKYDDVVEALLSLSGEEEEDEDDMDDQQPIGPNDSPPGFHESPLVGINDSPPRMNESPPLGDNDSPPGTHESPRGINESTMFVVVAHEQEASVTSSLASCISYRAMHPPMPLCSLQRL